MKLGKLRFHAVAVSLCLLTASVLGHVGRPTIHLADQRQKVNLEQMFPTRVGSWRLDENQPVGIVAPDVKALLDKLYAQTLTRTYVNSEGVRVMLSVAYGGDQSDATRAHRPDVCYPAQGFDIVSNRSDTLALPDGALGVRRMVAKLNNRIEPVTFWFAVGEYTAVTGQDQKLIQLRYGLRGIIPDGMLVRVSTINPDEKSAYAVQSKFIAELRQSMPQNFVSHVFGSHLKT
ncbi:exosortase-associated protein EpsI, B-type [Roseateles violae]|uniref:EpsI family protein n=1 Tax=Roseateles violae TaxID=3058042 RepID=A0ABT8DRA3_9BURK|nr:exosortase-associated protein EpsI, B-type [Pelomonas sp. PFR6]MDN3920861.1 EpsI family protein [Pelomonas sp. PFR6]